MSSAGVSPATAALLADVDQEMAATRRLLERVPDTAFAWRPHARSATLGGLANHLALIPRWGLSILTRDAHDLAAPTPPPEPLTTMADLLGRFDRHVADIRTALVEASDAHLAAPWALRRGSHLILSVPRMGAVRSFVLHHLIHHRGQMTVYLRLRDVPLPPLYGPTADESM